MPNKHIVNHTQHLDSNAGYPTSGYYTSNQIYNSYGLIYSEFSNYYNVSSAQ